MDPKKHHLKSIFPCDKYKKHESDSEKEEDEGREKEIKCKEDKGGGDFEPEGKYEGEIGEYEEVGELEEVGEFEEVRQHDGREESEEGTEEKGEADEKEGEGEEEEEGEEEKDLVSMRQYDEEISKTEGPTSFVLEPDHPMMERFQIALKNHLLKQIERLSNQGNDLKKQEKEKEQTGLDLYTAQQEIFKQQKAMEGFEAEIEKLIQERQALDESVKLKKTDWKAEVNRLNSEKKKESDMLAELRKLCFIEKQLEKWQNEMESEINVSQRISEKVSRDKEKLIEEKRNMDMFLLRLMTAISNFEAETKLLEGEIEVKLEEKETLNQTLADAEADLQGLMSENKRLMSAWNSVIATINLRNIVHTNASKELLKNQEAFRSLNSEIESYKRPLAEELRKSERLALILNRVESDVQVSQSSLKVLMDKKEVIENKLTHTAMMVTQVETEFAVVKSETEKVEKQLQVIMQTYEKLYQEKRSLEDDIVNYLQNQLTSDKTATNYDKLVRAIRKKTRKQEFDMMEFENKISRKFLEAENYRQIIAQNNEIIRRMNKDYNLQEGELKKYNEEIEKCYSTALQKQGNYATLTKKIEKQTEKTLFLKPGQNFLQLRIIELEKSNNELQSKNEKMQEFWLLQQNNNVKLTERRSDQLKDINLLKKQVLLLEHKVLKMDTAFEQEKKSELHLNKSIAQLQYKLLDLNGALANKRDYKENLGKANSVAQLQNLQNLKTMEHEMIQIKSEIKELEGSLEELAETMLATQREILAWEKKIKLAQEAKIQMKIETSSTGEVGKMKAEIHRMEVRYSQLKKAQDKLITDLEQCVLRRDAIADGADAKEVRYAQDFNTRISFQKKLTTIRNNVRAVQNNIKKADQKITDTKIGHEELTKVIQEKEAHILKMGETTEKMNLQLEDAKLNKCENLEMLIKRQKKCKMYETLKNRKHRMLFKSERSLENEMQKEKNTNADLISVMEALVKDFPAYRYQLKRIYNTFRANPS